MAEARGTTEKDRLAIALHEIGAVKFGLFTLKSGLKSPIYIDLRVLISFPETLKMVGMALCEKAEEEGLEFDVIAGIPFAAIAIATAVSLERKWRMVFPRKEVKDYGTRASVEGRYKAGETALVIDDLITTGASKFEAIAPLEKEGLRVKDVLVLVDREQGGRAELLKEGYRLHSVFTAKQLLEILNRHKKIDQLIYESAKSYFENPKEWQEGK
ncbi:Orotate phosphoribosyltransferase [uncultured archaeon]|nr:Orotate phosphoribosyltransferase [uncultured archaeon]